MVHTLFDEYYTKSKEWFSHRNALDFIFVESSHGDNGSYEPVYGTTSSLV